MAAKPRAMQARASVRVLSKMAMSPPSAMR
jgi:hypothetical protein